MLEMIISLLLLFRETLTAQRKWHNSSQLSSFFQMKSIQVQGCDPLFHEREAIMGTSIKESLNFQNLRLATCWTIWKTNSTATINSLDERERAPYLRTCSDTCAFPNLLTEKPTTINRLTQLYLLNNVLIKLISITCETPSATSSNFLPHLQELCDSGGPGC